MADAFNEMKKLDDEEVARDVRILVQQFKESGKVPDFNKWHKIFKRKALSDGLSEKGAQARATLKILQWKEALDPAHRVDP